MLRACVRASLRPMDPSVVVFIALGAYAVGAALLVLVALAPWRRDDASE